MHTYNYYLYLHTCVNNTSLRIEHIEVHKKLLELTIEPLLKDFQLKDASTKACVI